MSESALSTDELRDLLECNVCLEVPRTVPIYQCDRGHLFCSECNSQMTNCPVCQIPLRKTRCLFAEKALER